MSVFETRNNPLAMGVRQQLSWLLILSILLWTVGAPWLRTAHAAQVSNFSDTLSDSNLNALAKHTLVFTTNNAFNPGTTLSISLDPTGSTPGTSAFSEVGSAATSTDITLLAGATPYSIVTSCVSGNQMLATANYNNGSNENLTLQLCGSAPTINSGTVINIGVGTSTKLWTNPGVTGSYVIRLGGTAGISGDTRVAILQNVTVTASVDTTFTFTVSGLATSTSFNGITTTGSSTATALPFNTLVPNASSTLGQTLTVATNARNGFTVTVQENQPPTDSAGAIINLFKDGATTSSPTIWTHPSNTLAQSNTWSHFGVSSDDADEGGGEFVGAKYAGNFDQPRPVFSNTAPADGTTQNFGLAHVFYTMEVGTLQPAGTDYTDILTYVATPTF